MYGSCLLSFLVKAKVCQEKLQKQPKVFCEKRCSVKKGVLKNFQFRKACKFIKKRLQHKCFPVKFGKILRKSIFISIGERLFLKFQQTIAQILSLNFQFFPYKISFLKVHLNGPGKVVQFFINKKVCISTNGKLG